MYASLSNSNLADTGSMEVSAVKVMLACSRMLLLESYSILLGHN